MKLRHLIGVAMKTLLSGCIFMVLSGPVLADYNTNINGKVTQV